MKQIRFIPSGCQFWCKPTIAASGNQFAFCSSTAIYIMRISDMQVDKILTGHDHTITSLSWSQQDPSHLASTSADGSLIIWDIDKEKPIAKKSLGALPLIVEFSPLEDDLVSIVLETGEIKIYHLGQDKLEKLVSYEGAKLARWNFLTPGRLAFGTKGGLVGFYNLKTKKTVKLAGEFPNVPVEDLQWDPNSQEYLIACWKDGAMSLIDADSGNEMTKFEKQGPLSCICWLKNVPGGFVTCNDKVSTLKVWNVSKKTPLSTIKVGGAPILNLINLVNTSYAKDGFLVSFKDGSVGLYNYAKKSIEYATQPNHSETIFDMAFKPSNKNILATGSYDGSIKIWETNQMKYIANLQKSGPGVSTAESVKSLKHNIVYGIAWSPENPNQLVSVTSKGEVILWDTAKIRLLSEVKPGSENPIIRVDWNAANPGFLVVGHSDGFAFIIAVTNNTLTTKFSLKHPGAVYGVAWSPFNKNLLATCCQDGGVRIWDYTTQTVVNHLVGHTARAFNVAWNPLIPNVLASGSDDNTIRIWDIKQKTSSVLSGHSNNVRAIVWNTEVPWLISTGSWDHSIITWDARDQTILGIAKEHHADVYAIASHPERPFVYVSCSRDTSVRFWSLGKIVIPLMLRVLVTNDWDDIMGIAPTSLDVKTDLLKLCGAVSRRVANETGNLTNDFIEYYDKILGFFSYLDYQKEFWDISRAILKNKNEDVTNRIVSLVNLPSIYLSQAKELESKKDSSQFTYDSTSKKSETIMDAANMYLKLGEFELYCEALIKLGKWEKALAFAPAVSYDYWKNLAKRHAQELASDGAEDTGAYYLVSGQITEATNFYVGRGSYEDARLVAALKANNKFAHLESTDRYQAKTKPEESLRIGERVYNSPEIREIISNLAEDAMKASQPLLAAAYHLSICDGNSAVSKLLRANEPLYAMALCKIYDLDIQPQVYLTIAQKADRMGERFLGNILLNQLQNKAPLEIFCADSPLQRKETNELYLQNGLSGVDKFESEAQKYLEKGRVAEAVKYYVLSKNTEKACSLAASTAIDCLTNKKFERIAQLPEIFEPLKFAQIYTLKELKLRNEILGLSLYLGLKKAMWKGHYPIVAPILRVLKRFLSENASQLTLPINIQEVELEVMNFEALWKPEETYSRIAILHKELKSEAYKGAASNIAKNVKEVLSSESKSITKKMIEDNLNRHKVYIPGNNLPTHINPDTLPISYLSGIPIKADAYILEDVKTRITLEEALMWSECCMFSPLNTGITVNPL